MSGLYTELYTDLYPAGAEVEPVHGSGLRAPPGLLEIGGWEAFERANAGWVGMTGRASGESLRLDPDAYRSGDWWHVTFQELGHTATMFSGEMKTPAISEGIVDLSASGPAKIAERDIRRYFLQDISFASFESADSDPYTYPQNRRYQIDVNRASLVVVAHKDEDFDGGEQVGAVMWKRGGRFTRLVLERKDDDYTSGFEWVLKAMNTEDSDVSTYADLTEIDTFALDAANPKGTPWVVDIGPDYDLLYVSIRKVGAATLTQKRRFVLGELNAYGLADDEDFTTSDVARLLFSMIGVEIAYVHESGVPGLPGDYVMATAADVLDHMTLLSGPNWTWLLYRIGTSLAGYFGPFGRGWGGDRWEWTVIDPEAPRDLLPQDPFSGVMVAYTEPNGSEAMAEAIADPNPLGKVVWADEPFQLDDPAPESVAQRIAENIADAGVEPRWAGPSTFDRVQDSFGRFVPAAMTRAGGRLHYPELGDGTVRLPIDELRRFQSVAQATHLPGVPMIERVNARRGKRRERRRA